MHLRVSPHRVRLSALVALLPLGLAGCGALTGEDDAAGDGRQVVAAFYPLEFVTQQVAGDRFAVSNLTAVGGEPHDLELTVRETADLASADLVVYLEGFQPAVDDAVAQNVDGEVLQVTDVVDLEEVADHSDKGHAEEEAHAEEEDDAHDHGDEDPHFWLDPLRVADLGDAVADRLGELDPEHADEYAANAEDLRAEMEDLDAAYREGLASCERDVVVVNHDAFGYLAKYGLHLEPIVGLSPDAEPTPADLSRLQQLIRDEGITTVFAETLDSRKAAETLAGDLDLEVAVLDPVEGLTDAASGEDYLSLMRTNLEAIMEANGC